MDGHHRLVVDSRQRHAWAFHHLLTHSKLKPHGTTQTGEVVDERKLHEEKINCISWDKHKVCFITASNDQRAHLVDAQTLGAFVVWCGWTGRMCFGLGVGMG